jgi:hypothetical protein
MHRDKKTFKFEVYPEVYKQSTLRSIKMKVRLNCYLNTQQVSKRSIIYFRFINSNLVIY